MDVHHMGNLTYTHYFRAFELSSVSRPNTALSQSSHVGVVA